MADKKYKVGKGGSWAYSDPQLRQYLIERMKRNQDLGLEASPEITDIFYNAGLGDNVAGQVNVDSPTRIIINPKISDRELLLKSTIAHELDHVNALNAEKNAKTSRYTSKDNPSTNDPDYWKKLREYDYSRAPHENPDYLKEPENPFDSHTREDERRRVLYSITHPFSENRPLPYEHYREDHIPLYTNRTPVFSQSILEKYAKEAGVPVDEIIDAMVRNSAVRTDKLVKEAHKKTKENQKQGRGLFGELFENKMSTEDVYRPWKDLKETRKKK